MILVSAQAFPPSSGGIENLMEGLAHHTALIGHEVIVLADGAGEARRYDAARERPYRVERFTGPRPFRRWSKARRIAGLLRQGRITAIIADSWKSLEALPRDTGSVPVMAYAHGNEIPFDGPKRDRIRRALTRSDRLIVVSRDTLERRSAGCTPDDLKVAVVHPPVHALADCTDDDRRWADALWDGASPRLLSMCRLIDWKGIDQAIRATAALGKGRLIVAGEGGDRARLEDLVADLGAKHLVKFVGRVEGARKAALLSSAEVFLQPGRDVNGEMEGFGISYVEAALAGLPSISGRAGGAKEAVLDGQTGFVVDGDDIDAVTTALRTLVDDPALRARFSETGRAHGEAALWPRKIGEILGFAGVSETNDTIRQG
jgi:phosphatidylinositol alpha-1,6-mannosyltransferase